MARSSDSLFLACDSTRSPPLLTVRGDWTLANYAAIGRQVGSLSGDKSGAEQDPGRGVDLAGLAALDTAGASLLLELLGPDLAGHVIESDPALSAERRALLRTVAAAQRNAGEPAPPSGPRSIYELVGRVGLSVSRFTQHVLTGLGFMGLTLEALALGVFHPGRWRITSVVAQVQQIALDAVPIVALLTFMVGAVIAFLGATVLADFGATMYTVQLVAFSFLREFAVLLTAILIAGRTTSAFTAQIGSMKANEEIDAIRMTGLSPIDVLVLPRVLALLISMPILTFIGMVSGILGGALVCAISLDISLPMFFSTFRQDIEIRHFWLGMSKAPIFAYIIAIIGCLEGFKVSGSAQSVGEHTTSAVVQSIFIVILLDAVAALFFMEMGW